MPHPLHRLRYPFAALLAVSALLAGCGADAPPPAASPQADTPAYAAIARGRIDVDGGLASVSAPLEGVVTQVLVREGQSVKRGQPLIELDDTDARQALDIARAELAQLQARHQAQAQRLPGLRDRAQRLDQAAGAGAVDGQSADDARAATVALQAELASSQADIDLARQRVKAGERRLERLTLRAPLDGDILRLQAQPGNAVSPQGGELLRLLPNRRLIVRAELNESFLAAVRTGMRAEVVAESNPGAPAIAARVERIGRVFQTSTLNDPQQDALHARSVESLLSLDADTPLRVGQRVLVRFVP